jgi:transmembrane sensor
MNAQSVSLAAARWLERIDCEAWSDADQRALDAWLDASPAHRLAYWRVRGAWSQTVRLAALRPREAEENPKPPANWRRIGIAAASIAVIAGSVATGAMLLSGLSDKPYSTGIGIRETITLPDGSQIDLNTDTSVRVAESQRKATLERGEAFFLIKHNAAHPFVVVAGDQRIVDLGTKFTVRQDTDRTEVALVEGRARIEPLHGGTQAQIATLKPGDVAVGDSNSLKIANRSPRELADELGWREGVLIFRRTPLADAVTQFNRYNMRKLVVADRAAGSLQIGGTFQANNPDVFARVARDVLGLHVETRGGEIVISR